MLRPSPSAFIAPCPSLTSAPTCPTPSHSLSRRSFTTRRRPRRRHAAVCSVAPAGDYSDWSADFLELCRTQLDLLSVTIGDISQVVLFFRRENRSSGALEFVPLAVKSVQTRQSGTNNNGCGERVWIASESGLEIPTRRSTQLPGGVPAATILPSYPAMASEDCMLPDGGLCVPVKYNDAVAGSICLWKKYSNTDNSNSNSNIWKSSEVDTAKVVARTISIAATMEGKSLIMGAASTASSLGTITHQMRSPITALVTFGHVLLRKLPPGHRLRQLAKSIVVEALRLDELLAPLDTLTDKLKLVAQTDEKNSNRRLDAESAGTARLVDMETNLELRDEEEEGVLEKYDRLYSANGAQTSPYSDLVQSRINGNKGADDGDGEGEALPEKNEMEVEIEIDMEISEDDEDDIFFEDDEDDDEDYSEDVDAAALEKWQGVLARGDWISPAASPSWREGDGEVVWLSDLAGPIIESVRFLAEEKQLTFSALIDGDAPAALVCSSCDVRESIYNLLNNALAYTPAGGSIGLVVMACQVLVWDTGRGVDEKDAEGRIWEFGRRNISEDSKSNSNSNSAGKGIGLAVAKNTAEMSHGTVAVLSPLPKDLDPRGARSDGGGDVNKTSPGSVFCLTFPRASGV